MFELKNFEILKFWFMEQKERIKFKVKLLNKRYKSLTQFGQFEAIKRFHDSEWIKKINEEYLPIAEANLKKYYRKESQRPSSILGKRRFEKSEKGIRGRKKVQALRHRKIRHFSVPEIEKAMIRRFYMDCPKGYAVDHIIPLSKGGRHSLDNMQWLTKSLNSKKHTKILMPLSDYPHCRLNIHEIL